MPVLLPYSQTPAASCELALAAAARCEAGCGVKLQGSQPAKTPWPAPSPSPASTCLIRIFLTCKTMASAGPVTKGGRNVQGMSVEQNERAQRVPALFRTLAPTHLTSQLNNTTTTATTPPQHAPLSTSSVFQVASRTGPAPRASASVCTCRRANGREQVILFMIRGHGSADFVVSFI